MAPHFYPLLVKPFKPVEVSKRYSLGVPTDTLDPEALKRFFEEMIPFNQFLGFKLESYDETKLEVVSRLEMKPEYIGNPVKRAAHGGLLSVMIDATAGTAAALSLRDISQVETLATVDMRVDYLQPALGQALFARATVMRSGKRIIAVRTDVYDENATLLALGSNVFHVAR